MKRIKLAIIGIVCLTIFGYTQSCSDSTIELETVPNLEIPEEFNEVGILHNEGLEYIFEEIKAQAIEYTKNPKLKGNTFLENREEFIKQATLKFCKQNKKLSKNIDICTQVITTSSLRLKSEAINYDPAIQSLLDEAIVVLSKDFKIEEITQLKTQLDRINKKAAETLSETDAAIIFCATSTGYHSYQYWLKNHRKWYFALHYPEILEQYNNDELNQLQLKRGQIKTKGWFSDLWNNVESWFTNTANNVSEWWDATGKNIILNDFMGAASGALTFSFGGGVFTAIGALGEAIFCSAYTPFQI
jgi:hypothetical protein